MLSGGPLIAAVRRKTEVRFMLNEPDASACDVVFQIPQSVLDALRFRRATQVLKHAQPVQALSTLDIAVAAASGTADSETVPAEQQKGVRSIS